MSKDWKNSEKREQYRRETGKDPLYADLPKKAYLKWLEENKNDW